MPNSKLAWHHLYLIVLVILLLLVPVLTNDPRLLSIIIMIGVNGLLAVTLRFIMIAGQISVAHAIFMGIGGYLSALLVKDAGYSSWLTLPLAGLVAAAVAVPIGYITLRIKGTYFILALFAFAEAVRLVFVNVDALGGPAGIVNIPRPSSIALAGMSVLFTSKVPYYYLLLALGVVTVVVVYRLEQSRVGLTFRSIAQADFLAESLGVNVSRYKIIAFTVGSMFASIIGAFYVHYVLIATPNSFDMWKAFDILVFAIVGGTGHIIGPFLGAAFLGILPEFLASLRQYEALVHGVILVLVALFMPDGLLRPLRWCAGQLAAVVGVRRSQTAVSDAIKGGGAKAYGADGNQ